MAKLVIGLTGYTCSGKSEVARLLEAKGFARLNLGDLTREAASARGLSLKRDESWKLFKSLADQDPRWRVARVLDRIRALRAERVVLDGVRTREEAESFRDQLGPGFLLMEVRVDEARRLERAATRRREVDPGSWDEAARVRWQAMDREEVDMIDRLRPLVELVIQGGE